MRFVTSLLGAVAVSLAGCHTSEDKAPDLLETGWFPSADDTDGLCGERLFDTVPADGASGWYWRNFPRVNVEAAWDGYGVRLTEASGVDVPVLLVPANGDGLAFDVVFEGGLKPRTGYVLEFTDCAATTEISFSTSALGTPIMGGPASLLGRTYELGIDDPTAVWVHPGGLGGILGSFFNTPILLGVQWVDGEHLDWLGAQGFFEDGRVWQDPEFPTWNFPLSAFAEAPFFVTDSTEVSLVIGGFDLPIYGFHLEGTFTSDGAEFAGGVLAGLGDTRYSGGALGQPSNPDAMCTLSAGIGVFCEPCPDTQVYCLKVELHNLIGHEVPDTTLDVVPP